MIFDFSYVYRLSFEIFSQEDCSKRKIEAHQPHSNSMKQKFCLFGMFHLPFWFNNHISEASKMLV